jgi:hypothetical protein
MIKVLINYPNPHIAIHANFNCGYIQCQNKSNQRYIIINPETISIELQNFLNKFYDFGATPENNDMWLEIDFQDRDFELSMVNFIHRIISKNYSPFSKITPKIHCEDKLNRSNRGKQLKYAPLYQYLLEFQSDSQDITLDFNKIEEIINEKLPPSAYKYRAWWSNEKHGVHVSAKAWMTAGWKVETVNQKEKWVRFCRKS